MPSVAKQSLPALATPHCSAEIGTVEGERFMAAPPKEGGSFTPTDIKQLAQALEIAVREAYDKGIAIGDETELRRRLATLIYNEACIGTIEAQRLARIALHSLRLMSAALSGTLGRSVNRS